MPFTSWRGTLGLIKPTHRPGSLEETIRLLPAIIFFFFFFLRLAVGAC